MAERVFPLNPRFRMGVVNDRGEVVPSPEFIREYGVLWKRVGEYNALSNPELEALIDEAQADPSLQQSPLVDAALYAIRDEIQQQPAQAGFFTPDVPVDARIQALESLVAEMTKEIEALKQGALL